MEVIEEENSDDEDEIIVINESDSRTVNNCIRLAGYSDSENEDKKHENKEDKMKTRAATTYQFLTMKMKSKSF